MTWQLFSPDLPFLNQITVSQHLPSFWDNPLPYIPALGAVISVIGVGITAWLAKLARGIAIEQKKIAKDKFDIDLFNKRIEIYQSFIKMYNFLVTRNYSDQSELEQEHINLLHALSCARFLFSPDDIKKFKFYQEQIRLLYKIRKDEKNIDHFREVESKAWIKFHALGMDFMNKYNEELRDIIKKYLPDVLSEQFSLIDSTTSSPEAHQAPQPTGPKATLMRLKRAACGWTEPLQ